MKNTSKEKNIWHQLGLKRCVKIVTILLILLLSTTGKSETITTGNLLPNAGDGVDWNSSATDMINDGSSGYVTNGSTVNGFTINCTNQTNCGYKYDVGGDFEVTGTATVSVDDIALTSNSITQPMLDNGITLNSYIDVANCESVQGNCEAKSGNNDSHTTTVKLKDVDGTVLSTVSQTRTEQVGFQGNCNGYPTYSGNDGRSLACGQYTDTIIYNDVGSNKVDWSWSGTDTNYTNQSIQGVNLLGASLKMTYNNIEFTPIDTDTQQTIDDIDENIPDIEDDFFFNDFINFEDEFIWEDFEEIIFEEELFEEDFETIVLEEFSNFEEFEEAAFEELEVPEEFEEFFSEEFTEEEMEILEEEFADEFKELSDEVMEDVVEEKPTELATAEEEEIIEEEANEEKEVATNEEKTDKEENKEVVDDEKETEVVEEETKTVDVVQENKEVEVAKTEDKKINIEVNENIKVEVKEISLFDNGNKLAAYESNDFYKPETIYSDQNNALFVQTDLSIYDRGIYLNIGLDNYISTDPLGQHDQKLYNLKVKKLEIMIELQKLKELL